MNLRLEIISLISINISGVRTFDPLSPVSECPQIMHRGFYGILTSQPSYFYSIFRWHLQMCCILAYFFWKLNPIPTLRYFLRFWVQQFSFLLKIMRNYMRMLHYPLQPLSKSDLLMAYHVWNSELYIYGKLTSVNYVIKKCNTKWRKLKAFLGVIFSPLTCAVKYFCKFLFVFCGGKSFGMGFLHFKTARQGWNCIYFVITWFFCT